MTRVTSGRGPRWGSEVKGNGGSLVYTAEYTADGQRWKAGNGGAGSLVNSYGLFEDGTLGSGTPVATTFTPGFAERTNGLDRLYYADWLGSTRATTDGAPNSVTSRGSYDAYGQRMGSATDVIGTRFGFAGAWGYDRTDDPLGLHYLYQRYYDAAVGRFISRDPIGYAGGLNLYGYTGNDPVNAVDPSGLASWIGENPAVGPEREFEPQWPPVSTGNPPWIGFGSSIGRGIVGYIGQSGAARWVLSRIGTGAARSGLNLWEGLTNRCDKLAQRWNPLHWVSRVGSGRKIDAVRPVVPGQTLSHGFSEFVDNYFHLAKRFRLRKGVDLYQLEGSYNGAAGRFEWIIDGGRLTHRMFVKGGRINGRPIKP